VPEGAVQVSFARAGGAGGQHVNKVSTKAEVRFHVASASWLPEHAREALQRKARPAISPGPRSHTTSLR
jgi:peptidyl-tRNA hydrolase ICT1